MSIADRYSTTYILNPHSAGCKLTCSMSLRQQSREQMTTKNMSKVTSQEHQTRLLSCMDQVHCNRCSTVSHLSWQLDLDLDLTEQGSIGFIHLFNRPLSFVSGISSRASIPCGASLPVAEHFRTERASKGRAGTIFRVGEHSSDCPSSTAIQSG